MLFVITVFIFGIVALICWQIVIITKKKIYYKYIDTSKKITAYDYWTRYDGDWLTKDIDIDKLLRENSHDIWLKKSVKSILFLNIIAICSIIALLLFGSVMKYMDVV